MDYHELFSTLRYTIECRRCAGVGDPDGVDSDPCPVCLGVGIEAVSSAEVVIERRMRAGLRWQVAEFGYSELQL